MKVDEVGEMSDELVLIDREALLAELQRVFDARTSDALLHVLDKVAIQVHQAGVTRDDFRDLKQIVVDLAEAQHRTEEKVGSLESAMERLAEAQQKTADEIKELAAAQRRTEEKVGGLESAMERLAEAQQRTEERVGELAEAQRRTEEKVNRLEFAVEQMGRAVFELTEGIDRLRKQVGGLSETVGGDIEDIAYIVLHDVLKREFGWQVGVLDRSWQTWNDEPEEVNLFGIATDPARPPGTAIWIVGEAKHNLTVKEVQRFISLVKRARQHLVGEVFPVCFCYRARPEVQQMVSDAGIRLVFSYGKFM